MNLPLNIDLQQVLLHMFNFVLLTGGLYFTLYKPVKKFMDDRAAGYEASAEQARQKLTEAEAAKAEYTARLQQVDSEVEQLKADAMRQAQKDVADILADADRQRRQMLTDAREAAQYENDRLLQEGREKLAELAVQAAAKLMTSSDAPRKGDSDNG